MLWCVGFSLWWILLLWSTGSRRMGFSSCGSWALERKLSSCGAWTFLLSSMWDLPGPGLEPVSPALAGGFLTTLPPGKCLSILYPVVFPTRFESFLMVLCLLFLLLQPTLELISMCNCSILKAELCAFRVLILEHGPSPSFLSIS